MRIIAPHLAIGAEPVDAVAAKVQLAGGKVAVRMRLGGITGGRSETSLLVGGTLLSGKGDGGHQDERFGGRVEGQHPPG